MRKNRKHLYLSSTLARGRFLKAPEGDDTSGGGSTPQGGDSGQTPDNTQGNSTPATQGQSGDQNNPGQQLDVDGFWKKAESQDGGDQNQNGGEQTPDVGTQIVNDIKAFKLGTPIFDDSIATEIAEGKLDGINNRLNQMAQSVMQQTVVMTARLMKALEESMDQRVSGMIDSSQSQTKDEQLLTENFQAYSQPAMQPVIRGVFQQSLSHTKGDRKAAMEMTKGMLKQMGQLGREDFGIPKPPRNPDDVYGADSSASLVKDLLSM